MDSDPIQTVSRLTESLRKSSDPGRRVDRAFFRRSNPGRFYTNFGYSGQASPGGAADKPRTTVSFQMLRTMFGSSPIDKLIVQARLHQMRYVSRRALIPEKEVGWRVVHERSADPNFENTDEIERDCRAAERLIENVNDTIVPGGLRSFFNIAVRDELIYDRKVMIIARDAENLPSQYWTVDPTTIKPRLEVLAPWMAKNGVSNQQEAAIRFSEQLRQQGKRDYRGQDIDLTNAAYVQEIEGRIVAAWNKDQIDVDIVNPVNEIDKYLYGRSLFEDSLDWTAAFNAAFKYNTGWFQSKIPEQLVFLGGDVDEEGLDSFEKNILGQGASADFHRIAFVAGAPQSQMQAFQMRGSMRDMAFPQWIRLIIAGKAGCYRMDPRIINFDVATPNDSATQMKASNREMQLTLANEEGFHTLIMNMEAWLTRCLVKPRWPSLMLRWVGLDRPSELAQAEIIAAKMQYSSLDEVRATTGTLHPLTIPGFPELGSLPLNPVILQWMELLMQKRQLASAQAMQAQGQEYAESGGNMVPADGDESQNPASADAQPEQGAQPASSGAVQQGAAGAAGRTASAGGGRMQKSRRQRLSIEVDGELFS